MERIKEKNLKFHDQQRIDATNSNGFFGNTPLQKNEGKKYYDVGSTFYEDIQKSGLKCGKINQKFVEYIFHSEQGSWGHDIPGYNQLGKQRRMSYEQMAKQFENVNIENKFY